MSLRYDDAIEIDAPAETVWAVYSDVEQWPEWTASVTEVHFVSGDRIAPGARVRIRQPKLRPAEWTVDRFEPGRFWSWTSRVPGMRTTGEHAVEPLDDGRTRVWQSIVHEGPLGAIFGRMYGKLTRSYLATEAAGLKQRCEAHARA